MNMKKAPVEVVALTIGTASDQEFSAFEEASLNPGQVIWVQTRSSENYQLRFGDAFEVSQLKLERQGDDVVVHFPNGAKVILRDLAGHSAGQSLGQIRDQLFGVENSELAIDADQQQVRSQEESSERQKRGRGDNSEEREQSEQAAPQNVATDGEPLMNTSSESVSTDPMKDETVIGSNREPSDRGAGLWAGLGLLGTAGIALALDYDDDSQAPAPTFADGSDAAAANHRCQLRGFSRSIDCRLRQCGGALAMRRLRGVRGKE